MRWRWWVALAVLPAALRSQQLAEVKGIVIDPSGNPVSYAYVSAGIGSSTVSHVDGRFALRFAKFADSVTLTARRIGFKPLTQRFGFDVADNAAIQLVMTSLPTTLASVEVHGDAAGYDEYLDRSGYYRRVAKAIDGTFINYDKVVKRNPTEITALLTDVPGVHVERDYGKRGKGSYVLGRGGICVMGLVVDGRRVEVAAPSNEAVQPRIPALFGSTRMAATTPRNYGGVGLPSIDETIPVDMIGAIEVYPSAASVPNEFHQLTDGCGLIVVWTRYQK